MKLPIPVKTAIAFGIINSAVWYLLALKMGFYSYTYYGIRLLIMFGFIFIGVFVSIVWSKKRAGGYIEFKECLKNGMLYSLVLALVVAIFNYVYHNFITPDTIDFFCSEIKKEGIANKQTQITIGQAIEAQKNSFSSFRLLPPALFSGLIFSLLAGAILQKNNPNNSITE